MHTLQYQMLIHRNTHRALLRRRPPRHKHHTVTAHLDHRINHLLRQQLPPLALVRIRLAPAHRQTCVEQQHAAIGPRCKQTALLRRGLVVWVVDLQRFVDVCEGGGSGCGWADGEGEAVGLVGAVVGVLAGYDDFDGVEGGEAGPVQCISLD
jgi:hypothetical protein